MICSLEAAADLVRRFVLETEMGRACKRISIYIKRVLMTFGRSQDIHLINHIDGMLR